MNYLDHIKNVANEDAAGLIESDKSYGDSWKRRGGVGAFMMLARKWDRLENHVREAKDKWDIFRAAETDQRSEGVIDDIRDLRRYLMLVEAELRARGINPGHRDNQ